MKKSLAFILCAAGFASAAARAGELKVFANTPSGSEAYIIPVDGELAPTINLAVPRNAQSIAVGYVSRVRVEPAAGTNAEERPASAGGAATATEKSEAGQEYPEPKEASYAPATPSAYPEDPEPDQRSRLYISGKAGYNFIKISKIKMNTMNAKMDVSNPSNPALDNFAWLEGEDVAAYGENKARGTYAYAAGFEIPASWFGSFRVELEYSEADNHRYEIYSDKSAQPMRVLLAPETAFLNFYYDLPGFYRRADGMSAVRPYIGGGIGASKTRIHAEWEDYSVGLLDPNLVGERFYTDSSVVSRDRAYNYSAGVAFAMGAHFAIDIEFRHANYGRLRGTTEGLFSYYEKELGQPYPMSISNIETKTRANEFLGGLRISF